MNKTFLKILVATLVIVVAVVVMVKHSATANPSRIATSALCTTSGTSATTSVSYMSAGTGTTTVSCDLGRLAALSGGVDAVDSAVLGIQFHASGTASVLGWKVEYSQDGIDWYQDDALTTTNIATSTYHVGTVNQNLWVFASSTIGTKTAPADSSTKLVNLSTPTRHIRVIFFQPVGSLRGAVWAQIVAKSEILR